MNSETSENDPTKDVLGTNMQPEDVTDLKICADYKATDTMPLGATVLGVIFAQRTNCPAQCARQGTTERISRSRESKAFMQNSLKMTRMSFIESKGNSSYSIQLKRPFQKAYANVPQCSEHYLNDRLQHYLKRKKQEALPVCKMTINNDSRDPLIHFNEGTTCAQKGATSQTRSCWFLDHIKNIIGGHMKQLKQNANKIH
ncbi:MAG: hypothetical protein ABSH12_01575 [Endomicrobiales bacterium]